MEMILTALAAVVFLSSAASAAEVSKTKEQWTRAKSGHSVSGTAVRHSAVVHPANAITGGPAFASPNNAASSLPSYGGGDRFSGPSQGSTVRPLRAMPRSRTSGSAAFGVGPVVQGGYTTGAATPSRSTSGGGGTPIASSGKGGSISGPGVTTGQADAASGGGASGADPLAKIVAGLGSMFGDMAKAMSAMWGGGG
ncbi:MAG: hypothetical protein ACHQ49_17955 [Elusimicrobiota bacterium]